MNPEKLTKAIYRVAIAFGILCFNINLGRINILPNWLGYWMILRSLEAIGEEEPSAELLRPLGQILMAWTGADWVGDILGVTVDVHGLAYIPAVVQVYFQFQLLTNLASIAARYVPQFEERILRLRTVMTVVITAYALVSALIVSEAVMIAAVVVQIVASVWLWRTLLLMEDAMTEVFGLKPQGPSELTFAERIQMNMENMETAED